MWIRLSKFNFQSSTWNNLKGPQKWLATFVNLISSATEEAYYTSFSYYPILQRPVFHLGQVSIQLFEISRSKFKWPIKSFALWKQPLDRLADVQIWVFAEILIGRLGRGGELKILTNIKVCGFWGSGSVLYVGADIFQLSEDLGEEAGFCVDPQHGSAEAVDDVDAPVPEAILVRFNEERLQGVAYFVAHVTAKSNEKHVIKYSSYGSTLRVRNKEMGLRLASKRCWNQAGLMKNLPNPSHASSWLCIHTYSWDKDRWGRWPAGPAPVWCSRLSYHGPRGRRIPRSRGWWMQYPAAKENLISWEGRKNLISLYAFRVRLG